MYPNNVKESKRFKILQHGSGLKSDPDPFKSSHNISHRECCQRNSSACSSICSTVLTFHVYQINLQVSMNSGDLRILASVASSWKPFDNWNFKNLTIKGGSKASAGISQLHKCAVITVQTFHSAKWWSWRSRAALPLVGGPLPPSSYLETAWDSCILHLSKVN